MQKRSRYSSLAYVFKFGACAHLAERVAFQVHVLSGKRLHLDMGPSQSFSRCYTSQKINGKRLRDNNVARLHSSDVQSQMSVL